MTRAVSLILVLAGLAGLSACGGKSGSSEFVAKATAACLEENGEKARAFCTCNVRLFDEVMSEKDKRYFVTIVMNEDVAMEKVLEETSKAGFTQDDMRSMAAHLAAINVRSDKECPKK